MLSSSHVGTFLTVYEVLTIHLLLNLKQAFRPVYNWRWWWTYVIRWFIWHQ